MGRALRVAVVVLYLILGFAVARSHGYLHHIHDVKTLISAVLGVALWPLILVGVNLHVKVLLSHFRGRKHSHHGGKHKHGKHTKA